MRYSALLSLGCALSALTASNAAAQSVAPSTQTQETADGDTTPSDAPETEGQLQPQAIPNDEIIVTARKREERLQDVPVTASAFTGDLIERRGLTSIRDVATLTPGLNVNGDAAGRAFVSIRGVGLTLVQTVQPGVGIFIDGVYQPNTSILNNPLVDVERVEVLRGPQGTLYGKNTLGGAINIISRQPGNKLEVRGGGSYAGPDNAWTAFGSISGPIVLDRLQARIAYAHREQDGFLRNPSLGIDANPLNTDTLNATVRAEPVDDVVLTVNGYQDWVKGTSTPYARVAGPKDYSRVVSFNAANRQLLEYRGLNARLQFPIAGIATDVTLLGAYDERKGRTPDSDVDFNPVNFARARGDDKTKVKTAELRLDTRISPTLSSLVAFYYSREVLSADGITTIVPNALNLRDVSRKTSNNYAVYGTLFWRPVEEWEVSAGLRYDREKRRLSGSTGLAGAPLAAVPGVEGGHKEISPRLTVTRHWTNRFMSYASVARGFRGGGFNINPRAPFRSYDGDKVWTYEAGSKFTSADRRLSLSGAFFYNDYNDLIGLNSIVGLPGGGFATVDLNTGDVKSYGVELEGSFRPTPQWTISGGVSVQHARLTDTSSYTRITGRRLASDRLPFQPDYNFSLNSDYVVPVGQGDVTFTAGVTGKGDRIAGSISETRAPVLASYALVNGAITYRIGGIEVAGFVNNLFNQDYFDSYIEQTTLALAVPFLPPSDLGIIGDRRRYGVRARFRF
ncbi:TonB-dependent receptor [Sphingomonas glaciei]|uniref:TonB-dependent receptor n=1 Tax=Sphingomonas glaciei TaxID=2938948 RepID=A0ABY5MXQ3_9SPHN|nr:TonB-dependent receptor [Sphingomonas glaciei]UUR08117.1 TonB-dependent receptor [Sphingomonas glaciei]